MEDDWNDPATPLFRGESARLSGSLGQPVPIESLLAVGRVTLMASNIPRGILKAFYTQTLALTFVKAEDGNLHLRHHQLEIVLDAEHREPGRVGLLTRRFSESLARLREKHIPYETFRTDNGLTRMALLRDPAGNLVQLIETRSF